MILGIYAIYDKLAGIWSNLFVLNDKVSNRTFGFMAKERNEESCKDQQIFRLGEYNNETGAITVTDPVMVYDLEKEWNNVHEN